MDGSIDRSIVNTFIPFVIFDTRPDTELKKKKKTKKNKGDKDRYQPAARFAPSELRSSVQGLGFEP